MNKQTTTRTTDAYGDTIHIYRGIEIRLNTAVSAGNYGRYLVRLQGRSTGASTLKRAKNSVDDFFCAA